LKNIPSSTEIWYHRKNTGTDLNGSNRVQRGGNWSNNPGTAVAPIVTTTPRQKQTTFLSQNIFAVTKRTVSDGKNL
jgi:hypothetical protein